MHCNPQKVGKKINKNIYDTTEAIVLSEILLAILVCQCRKWLCELNFVFFCIFLAFKTNVNSKFHVGLHTYENLGKIAKFTKITKK